MYESRKNEYPCSLSQSEMPNSVSVATESNRVIMLLNFSLAPRFIPPATPP